jgi:hypothetical protein
MARVTAELQISAIVNLSSVSEMLTPVVSDMPGKSDLPGLEWYYLI